MKKNILTLLIISILTFWYCSSESFSSELQEAYNWAYKNWITTQPTIETANMKWNITRAEMAKMISNYAKNILWLKPDTSKSCYFLNSNIDPTLVESVRESCQLWLMWQWISDFRPNDSVTRAEFWTVLSRTLWWDKNEWWDTYYQNHLKALKTEWIMNNISSPMDKEIRWYVMLMLMRSWSDNTNNSSTNIDNQISDVLQLLDD